jgi:membrane protease subunit HflC
MKKGIPSLIAGATLAIILIAYMVTYQIRFSEVAVIRTFGEATEEDVVTDPGLYLKWPWPIQKVSRYDNRIQFTSTTGEETPTRDAKNIIVTTAIGWRIENPYRFSIRCADMRTAADRLQNLVRSEQKTVIANYDFANFVSTDREELKYDTIEEEILATVAPTAADLYGIKLESIGIEKFALPQRITETVFEAMRKERQAVADQYTSEGESMAKQIKDSAESIAGTIISFADRKSAEIIAEGERRAAEYNKVFSQDEELAMFLLEISHLSKILQNRTTLIMDAVERPFRLLKQNPTTAPADGDYEMDLEDLDVPTAALPEMTEP